MNSGSGMGLSKALVFGDDRDRKFRAPDPNRFAAAEELDADQHIIRVGSRGYPHNVTDSEVVGVDV